MSDVSVEAPAYAAALARALDPTRSYLATVSVPRNILLPVTPSRAPARPYRIRVDTGPVGYLWLEWLGACARTAGVAQTSAP